ncbi:MAG: hypothetical protein V7L04_33140 [Nostoc sp.]
MVKLASTGNYLIVVMKVEILNLDATMNADIGLGGSLNNTDEYP